MKTIASKRKEKTDLQKIGNVEFATQYAPPVVQFPPNQGALHVSTAAGVLLNALPAYTSTPGLVNAETKGEEASLLPTTTSLPEPKDNGVAQEIKTMKEAIKMCVSVGQSFDAIIRQGEAIEAALKSGRITDNTSVWAESSSYVKKPGMTRKPEKKEGDIVTILPTASYGANQYPPPV
ncbi:hypothetical protein LOK49_LG04G02545 [Camellia lanceoleosa]|uniref:Uncharacterized protein n=1 Tax=Camellia lanceoleosa TaxID=1840588 RepID=A0ACC0I142_9ERIC|nr:hypothetical protein LOK49_LG04G02545 [Camellia lanceoleosa]